MLYLLPTLLFLATATFALGVTLPLIEVRRLYFLSNTPSLVAIVAGLWQSGDRLLAAVISLFSIGFPACKLLFLHHAAYGAGTGRVPSFLKALANWSMLDVLLVALVIFAAKTSGLATAMTMPGLWFFAASTVLTAAASASVGKKASAAAGPENGSARPMEADEKRDQ